MKNRNATTAGTGRVQALVMLDADGNKVRAGDWIEFKVGIPGRPVRAQLERMGKQLGIIGNDGSPYLLREIVEHHEIFHKA